MFFLIGTRRSYAATSRIEIYLAELLRYSSQILDGYTASEGGGMFQAYKQSQPAQRQERSGMERLGLRVSEMINHPIAQIQRWVTIHRLDTDGDREWNEVIGLLSETDGIDMTLNEENSITLRWERSVDGEYPVEAVVDAEEEAAPF